MTTPESASSPVAGEVGNRLLSLRRALLIALGIELAVAAGVLLRLPSLFPPPEPEPMRVELLKMPEPTQAPPAPRPPPPPPKKVPPKPQELAPPPPERASLPEPVPEPPPPPAPPPPPKEEPPQEQPQPPGPLKKVAVHYPKDLLSQGIEGRVLVRLTVSPTGKVLQVKILETFPDGLFDYAVELATKQYIFPPPGESGGEHDEEVIFRIEADGAGEVQVSPGQTIPKK